MTMSETNEKRAALWIFFAFFSFYFLGLGGHINSSDGTIMFLVTKSIASEAKLDIQRLSRWPDFGGIEWLDRKTGEKKFYSRFGLGLSLSAVPAYLIGKLLIPFSSEQEKDVFSHAHYLKKAIDPVTGSEAIVPDNGLWYESGKGNFNEAFEAFSVTWTIPCLVAGSLAAMFLICTTLGFSLRASLALVVASGVATPLWHYSKDFFSEPLSGFGLMWFMYFGLRESRRSEPGLGWLLAGCALGILLLAKVANAVILIPCGILACWYLSQYSVRGRVQGGLLLITGTGAGAGIVLLYNFLRFGSVWITGYGEEAHQWTTPFWEGVAGLLWSPWHGVLVYCPLLFLALAGMRSFSRRYPREALFIGLTFLGHLLLYATWHGWEGGWCWGPRFFVPVLPISLLPAVVLFEKFPAGFLPRAAILVVLAGSFVVALNGVIVNYIDYYIHIDAEYVRNWEWFKSQGFPTSGDFQRWSWEYSPLVKFWNFPLKDYHILPRAIEHPGILRGIFVLMFLLFTASCCRLWSYVRNVRSLTCLHSADGVELTRNSSEERDE